MTTRHTTQPWGGKNAILSNLSKMMGMARPGGYALFVWCVIMAGLQRIGGGKKGGHREIASEQTRTIHDATVRILQCERLEPTRQHGAGFQL
jgi:hypothetical protein